MANMVVKRGLCCIVDTRDKIVIFLQVGKRV